MDCVKQTNKQKSWDRISELTSSPVKRPVDVWQSLNNSRINSPPINQRHSVSPRITGSSFCRFSITALVTNVSSKVRGCVCFAEAVATSRGWRPHSPVPQACVCWSSLGLREVKGRAQCSLLSECPYFYFFEADPKVLAPPYLGIGIPCCQNFLEDQRYHWRLWVSVRTTWAKQFPQNNQKNPAFKNQRTTFWSSSSWNLYARLPTHS